MKESLPVYVKNAIDKFCPPGITEVGLRVDDEYRNQKRGIKLGGLLWAIGCGFMETQGAVSVRIDNDMTVDEDAKRGFYERYGTKTYTSGRRGVNFAGKDKAQLKPAKKKYALAHLSPEQEIMVAKAFGINLLQK